MSTNKKKLDLQLKLKKLNDREKQLKAKMRAIDARERENARKKETRAKIILGGYIASKVKLGNERFDELFSEIVEHSNERDKADLIAFRNRISVD